MKLRWIFLPCITLSLAACGDEVDSSNPNSSSTGSGTSSSAGQPSSASTGAAGGTTGGSGGEATGGAGGSGGLPGSGGSTGGASNPACVGIEDIVPSDPTIADDDGDGAWSPGEAATVSVTMTNEASRIYSNYPGVTFASDDPLVSSAMPSINDLFGLAGGDSALVSASFVADASVPSGTLVHFTATVNSLNQTCPGVQSIDFDVTIE